jgi:ketosteroid isomerase-like protein
MSAEHELAAIEVALLKAMMGGDREHCERLLSPEFTLVRASGDHTVEIVLREAWLRDIGGGRGERSFKVDDQVVSIHGDVAVATVFWTDDTNKDTPRAHGVTDVWQKRPNGEWELLERHAA